MKRILLILIILLIPSVYVVAQDVYYEDGDLCLYYYGCKYVIYKYTDTYDNKYYSLQCWPETDYDGAPQGLFLVYDENDNLAREFRNGLYYADFEACDINKDQQEDLILFWHVGMHSTDTEVWLKDGHDYNLVFARSTPYGVFFTRCEGEAPALVFQKGFPKDCDKYIIYEWNSEAFIEI